MRFSYAIKEFEEFVRLEIKANTAQRYLGDIRLFCLWLRDPELSFIKDKDVVQYIHMMRNMGWTHNALVTKCAGLRRLWQYFNKKGWPTFNSELIPMMKKIPIEPRIAKETDYHKLLAVIKDERDNAIIRMTWDTGARCGEIASLRMQDLDLQKMKAVIRTEKSRGKKPFREVYWTTDTNKALKKWLAKKRDIEDRQFVHAPEAVFWSQRKNKYGGWLRSHSIGIIFRKYSHLAKIPVVNPHSMRHHMGHDLAKKGANNSVISSILGHAELSSSYIYTELENKEREEQYNKFIRNEKK